MTASRDHRLVKIAAFAAALVSGGCAGGPELSGLGKALQSTPTEVAAPPVEVYTRIAKGARNCWFGSRGAYATTHIFHADADSPAKGGAVQIAIHQRLTGADSVWGAKAFQVAMTGSDSSTAIMVENLKMPDADAQLMRADVYRWAHGSIECSERGSAPPTGPFPPASSGAPPAGKP